MSKRLENKGNLDYNDFIETTKGACIMKENDRQQKRPVLRFRFIILFSVLLLAAIFVIYMLGTSLEDVIDKPADGSSEVTRQTEQTTVTQPPRDEGVVFVETTTAEPEDSGEQ